MAFLGAQFTEYLLCKSPKRLWDVSPMTIIGIDIGGTKCAIVRAGADGAPVELRRFATTTVVETLARLFSAVADAKPGAAPVFGVACGGPLDSAAGVILSPPNLPGWDRIDIVRELTTRFGGRAFLMNDANAGALAEWRFGAARGCRNVIFLTHGTGMGAGLILDGRLYEGTTGDAGEVGHLRLAPDGPVGYGKPGSFEGFCSGGGLALQARTHGGFGTHATARDLIEAARAGNPEALGILAASGHFLGQALAVLVDILNPDVIVLGSLYARAGEFFATGMRQALAAEALPRPLQACRIVPATLGEQIGNYAAVAVAQYRLDHGQASPKP